MCTGLLAAWWFLSAGSTDFFFPPLSEILDSLVEEWFGPRLAADVLPSLWRLTAGYLVAAVAGVTLGGLGSIGGSFAAAVLLGLIESFGTHFTNPSLKMLLSYGIFVLILMTRPRGLFAK